MEKHRRSAWKRYLAGLPKRARRLTVEWADSRPAEIRELCRRFPPGTRFEINGQTAYVVGFQETAGSPGFLLSDVDPNEDYEGAMAGKFLVCGMHSI